MSSIRARISVISPNTARYSLEWAKKSLQGNQRSSNGRLPALNMSVEGTVKGGDSRVFSQSIAGNLDLGEEKGLI
jgi:hypothetical protein